ncbi:MAG: 4'-phosphopantetheinyl transferase superfamily protein [Sandaracinus sp.]
MSLLAPLLGPEVVLLDAPIDPSALDEIAPEERALVAAAHPKRQREFATARKLARQALGRLGIDAPPLLNDPDRAPIWPPGIRGSVTHCDTRALVAVCRAEHGSVGIDVEHRAGLKPELWPSVFLASEIEALEALPESERARRALVLFSAKEALYKAQFPLSRTYMGFRALHVHAADGVLECTWQTDVPGFPAGTIARGRYLLEAPPTGEVLTGILIV